MGIFSNSDTVDGKARSVLGALPEDPAPYAILQEVDQKTADSDVDPDDVVSKVRDLDGTVDQKLASLGETGADQKEMRDAAGVIADRTDLSQADSVQLLSTVVDGVENGDASALSDAVDDVVSGGSTPDIDQAADTDATDTTSTMDGPSNSNDEQHSDGASGAPDDEVDQKQEEEEGDGEMTALDLVEEIGGSDERDNIEAYAESVGKDAEECAGEWVAENVDGVSIEGQSDSGSDSGGESEPAAPDTAGDYEEESNGPDRSHDQMTGEQYTDQKLEDRVANAVTSDAVIDKLADEVSQKMDTDEVASEVAKKMVDDDDLADDLVETVDQKGDFVTTDGTTMTASSSSSQTVGEAKTLTEGDSE